MLQMEAHSAPKWKRIVVPKWNRIVVMEAQSWRLNMFFAKPCQKMSKVKSFQIWAQLFFFVQPKIED